MGDSTASNWAYSARWEEFEIRSFLLVVGLVFFASASVVHAQSGESCGPKSGLCWPVLKRGSSGPRVVALQYLLLSRGYRLAPDGCFAFATENAVRAFQRKNKLQTDGKVGWQSWEALTPNLKRGAKGNAVKALQTLLVFQKQKVARDGVFGSSTQKAIYRFTAPEAELMKPTDRAEERVWCWLSGGTNMSD